MALLDREDSYEDKDITNQPSVISNEELSAMISILPLHLQLHAVRINKLFDDMSREQSTQMCKYLYTNHLIMEEGYKNLLKQEMINNGSIPLNFK